MTATKQQGHTPGPWRVEDVRGKRQGVVYYRITAPGVSVAGVYGDQPANARRIVACVNACEGFADPAVAISGLRARSDNVAGMCAEVETLRSEVAALRTAGERCLAALRANGAPNCEAAKEMVAALAR